MAQTTTSTKNDSQKVAMLASVQHISKLQKFFASGGTIGVTASAVAEVSFLVSRYTKLHRVALRNVATSLIKDEITAI